MIKQRKPWQMPRFRLDPDMKFKARLERAIEWARTAREARRDIADLPYPFCRTPGKCRGKGYCPNDPACNE